MLSAQNRSLVAPARQLFRPAKGNRQSLSLAVAAVTRRPMSSDSNINATSSAVPIGLGSSKWQNSSDYPSIVREAINSGIDVIEVGPDGGSVALAEIIDRPNIRALKRIGYRTLSSKGGVKEGDKVIEELTSSTSSDEGHDSAGVVTHNLSVSHIQEAVTESVLQSNSNISIVPMIHNPEVQGDDTLDALTQAFCALEELIQKSDGSARNVGYGIVSNGLGLPSDHPLHLSPSTIWKASEAAAKEVGVEESSLKIIELPINLLETQGIAVARQIVQEQKGRVEVFAMRPLTCYPDRGTGTGHPFELLDYEIPVSPDERRWTNELKNPPLAYQQALNAAMAHFDGTELLEAKAEGKEWTVEERETMEACKLLQSLLHDMDVGLSKVRSWAAHEAELLQTIIPNIYGTVEEMDEESSLKLQNFFVAHGWAVRFATAQATRKALLEGGTDDAGGSKKMTKYDIEPTQRLQDFGLSYLLKEPSISKVVVGCTEVDHIVENIALADRIAKE